MSTANQNIITSSISWDQYFMSIAYMVAAKSKDPRTQVGCVIVGSNNEIVSTGFNGFPRGVQDLESRYRNSNYKYMAGNHAEENAILNAANLGLKLRGCIIYVPWLPCAYCAKMIVQVGVAEVVYHAEFPGNNPEKCAQHWSESMIISREIFAEGGVKVRSINGRMIMPKVIFAEEEWNPC